jgi:hypothetical protein
VLVLCVRAASGREICSVDHPASRKSERTVFSVLPFVAISAERIGKRNNRDYSLISLTGDTRRRLAQLGKRKKELAWIFLDALE